MRRFYCSLLLCFALLSVPVAGSNIPDGWQGLWEVTQETEREPVTLYLWLPVNNQGKVSLYGTNWNSLALSSWSVRGSELTFNWQTKGVNTFFKGTRNSRTVSGEWQLVHPQYVLKQRFTARKLHSLENWTPVAFAPLPDSRTRIIDGAGQGLEHLQKGTFDTFEARFFALASGRGSLSSIRQTLENGAFQKDNAELKGIVEEIIKSLRAKHSGYSLPVDVVLLPLGGLIDERQLLDRTFILLNAAEIDAQLSLEQRKGLFVRALLELGLQYDLPRISAEIATLWTRAVPLGVAKSLGITEQTASILQLAPEEYERLRQRLPALKSAWRARNTMSPSEQDVLALAFAEHLGSLIAPARLGFQTPDQMKQLYDDFLKP